jgi:hypothetical protein
VLIFSIGDGDSYSNTNPHSHFPLLLTRAIGAGYPHFYFVLVPAPKLEEEVGSVSVHQK